MRHEIAKTMGASGVYTTYVRRSHAAIQARVPRSVKVGPTQMTATNFGVREAGAIKTNVAEHELKM